MSFESDIKRHQAKRDRNIRAAFVDATVEVKRSIVEGSELTGAPGQPIGQYPPGSGRRGGTLRASWVGRFVSRDVWRIVTNLIYAPIIEAGAGITIRSTVGGTHSVAKTRTGWSKIVHTVGNRHRDR